MNLGHLLTFRIRENKMELAGYAKVPSHAYGTYHDQEWITGYSLKPLFPRFHVIKQDGRWFVHLDTINHADRSIHKTLVNDVRVTREIRRLKRIHLTNIAIPLWTYV